MKNNQYLFGKKSLIDAINNNLKISKIYLTNKHDNFLDFIKKNNLNYEIVNNQWFNRFDIKNLNHQFIAYLIDNQNKLVNNQQKIFNYLSNKKNSVVLIVDQINDSRNFGAILRSCDAFGVDAIFYKKNNQVDVNEIVNSISMGATNYLNLCCVANLINIVEKLKKIGYWVYASTLSKNSIDYSIEKYPNKICLIVGNENKGISDLLINNSDLEIHIPMFGHVQSLNVSVATGILLSYFRISKK